MYSNATTAQVAIRSSSWLTARRGPSILHCRALEIVDACTGDYREMLPAANNFYRAFTDPSGGSDDSFALAISCKTEDRTIIDAIRPLVLS